MLLANGWSEMASTRIADKLARRIGAHDVTFRTKLIEAAAELNDVIALGRGDPDFATPTHIAEAAKRAIDEDQHHYTHPTGLPELRRAIAASLNRDFQLDYEEDEIVVTAGVQESIMLSMLGLIEDGDEVLIPSPRFTTYDTAVEMCGGVPIPVETHEEDDFALMAASLDALLTERTKLVVLVSPNNPTGAVTPPSEIAKIAKLALERDLLVLSDEIYAKLLYDGAEHLSIASLEGMKDRTITLNGFSKTYAMTGWRVGYLAAPRDFVRRMTEPRHTLSINTSTPSQFAALEALTGTQEPVQAMHRAYAERRAFLLEALDDLGFTYGKPNGAFYIYTNVTNTGMRSHGFCERLLHEARVLLFPGALFGDQRDKYVRISYLQPMTKIREAVDRLGDFVAETH